MAWARGGRARLRAPRGTNRSFDTTRSYPDSGLYGGSAIFRHFKLESATENWNLHNCCRLSFSVADHDASVSRFAEFSSKWWTGFSHLRGESENRTVVQGFSEYGQVAIAERRRGVATTRPCSQDGSVLHAV